MLPVESVEVGAELTEGSIACSNFMAWDFTTPEDFLLSWRLGFSGLDMYSIKSGSLSHTTTCCSWLSVCLLMGS